MIPDDGISFVVPAYNERDNIEALHAEIAAVAERLGARFEIVLVDDGSVDGGGGVMDAVAAHDPRVRVLHLARRSGQTAALLAGFAAARGAVVVTLDADLQNDPADIPRLLEALPGHGAAIGRRARRHDHLVRRISSRIANGFRNWVTRDDTTDTGCSLKAFRRAALAGIPAADGMHRFLPILVKMRGYSVVEIAVGHRPRRAGRSKYGIGNRLFVGLGDLFLVRWMQIRGVTYEVAREAGRGLEASVEAPRAGETTAGRDSSCRPG